jgi:hypothetical protein
MAFANYSDLQASIANWLNRDDLTAQIPDFIAMAEARFNRELRTIQMVKRATATTSNEFVAVPADWLEAKDLDIGGQPLAFITQDKLTEWKNNKVTGKTRFYTIVGKEFELFPAPTSDVTVEMTYYAKIPSLSISNTSNWLLTKAPDLYLYGSLQQASTFLMDDMRLAAMAANATAIIQFLNNESDDAAFSGAPLITRTRSAY